MQSTDTIPAHVGLILDGNRRWAKSAGLPALEGHRRGLDVLKDISFHAYESGVKYLSAYIFSTENWQRTEEEVNYLMDLVIKAVEKYLDEYNERGIKLVILGRKEGIRQKVLDAIQRAEEKTKNNTKGVLALCFNYGGHEEIIDAFKHLISDGIQSEEVTNESIEKSMYHGEIPPVDLLIRTSGEQRISGFMLYRSAYAELKFFDKHWPDFTVNDFDDALTDYAARERRFGN